MSRKNKNKEINIFDNIPTISDILLPDTLQEKTDYLVLGYNKYSRTFAITIYPKQTWIGWLDNLSYIGNINISVKVESVDPASAVSQLSRRITQIRSEYSTYSKQRKYIAFTRT